MPPSALDALLDRLTMAIPAGWDLGLERIERLLAELGNPHHTLPPVIHVAGTNGKGSVTAFCRAILEAAGKTCHVYTSPHLVRFNERIRIAHPGGGRLADDDVLAAAILEAEQVNAGRPITFFELATVAAFRLFAQHPADYTLLEVGLGGRLDATNVIPAPLVSVITSISVDHEKFLGDTIEKIAAEKAGIIKRGAAAVSSPQAPEVVTVLERRAAREGVRIQFGGQDWIAGPENGRLVYQDADGLLDLTAPRLLGAHQFVNAGTAVAALRAAGIAPDNQTIGRGLETVEWPARMQRLGPGPVTALAPAGAEVWLDGGHNPGAGEVVAQVMGDLEERVPRPLFLIAGMLKTKDPVGFFRPFAGLARHVFTVPIHGGHETRTPEDLAAAATAGGLSAEPVDSLEAALARLASGWQSDEAPRILICGSLYLAGEVLKANGALPA
ncbi:bifunctional folylpolyglutamate synthase/dihydrofolate synthase [Prosthecomicrobium hirschii]|uniref:bifunctional folylpolyglutamate synthase/dihydrofolate synthase n=1 Tax=Prosthecodimorpha hirschii TaxID=665126 RepID=UPI00112BDAE0|nr:folylpolyglutamate synthase/dihydrofolate synthase family protein [Prosthecomicrobium hirschii]TPQ51559.1 bifunctional folylpolyglutamate synthase/dihydrofolate synthase [Prosthecomicrobium hirschii]